MTSDSRYRRWPPRVRIEESFPAFAHRVTVLGSTRNRAATSAGVSSVSPDDWSRFIPSPSLPWGYAVEPAPDVPFHACDPDCRSWYLSVAIVFSEHLLWYLRVRGQVVPMWWFAHT